MTCSSICDLEFVLLLWPTFCPKCGERAPLSHWRAQTSNSLDFRSDGPGLEIYQIFQPFNRQMMDDTSLDQFKFRMYSSISSSVSEAMSSSMLPERPPRGSLKGFLPVPPIVIGLPRPHLRGRVVTGVSTCPERSSESRGSERPLV